MPLFEVSFKVDQSVTKTILAQVVARNEEEAERIALEASNTYPEKVMDRRVNRMVTTNVVHWPPKAKVVEGITKKDKNG